MGSKSIFLKWAPGSDHLYNFSRVVLKHRHVGGFSKQWSSHVQDLSINPRMDGHLPIGHASCLKGSRLQLEIDMEQSQNSIFRVRHVGQVQLTGQVCVSYGKQFHRSSCKSNGGL